VTDFSRLSAAIGDLDEAGALEIVKEVAENEDADVEAAVNACRAGLELVGEQFETGRYFVADLIFVGDLMSQALAILKPRLGQSTDGKLGKIVLCTVEGDLHDIGKNIVKCLMEAGGFEVIDLGIDVHPDTIIETLRTSGARILGLSGVLTLAIDSMKHTVDALQIAGLRQSVKVIIGGVPVTAEICQQVGADAWNHNVAQSVKLCRDWASPQQ
jgi:dimethylamine corrinoid protein